MKVYSGSDIGLVRNSNQDYCETGVFSENAVWAVVCDGMGGANGGCVASSKAVEAIAEKLTEGYRPEMTSDELRQLMESAVQEANSKAFGIAQEDSYLYGMGTTVVCAVVRDGSAYVVHAGDSRAYMYLDDEIHRVTTDHSVVQELISAGHLTEEEARSHPNRNIITRALGVEPELETDFNTETFSQGAKLIICTDGLSGYFSDSELCDIVKSRDGDELVMTLINSAKERGGSDNITVAVISDQ